MFNDTPPSDSDKKKLNKKDYIYLGISGLGILVFYFVSKKNSSSSTSSSVPSSNAVTTSTQGGLLNAYQQGQQAQSQIDQQLYGGSVGLSGYGTGYIGSGMYSLPPNTIGGDSSLSTTSTGGATPVGTTTTLTQSGTGGATPVGSSPTVTQSGTGGATPVGTAPVVTAPTSPPPTIDPNNPSSWTPQEQAVAQLEQSQFSQNLSSSKTAPNENSIVSTFLNPTTQQVYSITNTGGVYYDPTQGTSGNYMFGSLYSKGITNASVLSAAPQGAGYVINTNQGSYTFG